VTEPQWRDDLQALRTLLQSYLDGNDVDLATLKGEMAKLAPQLHATPGIARLIAQQVKRDAETNPRLRRLIDALA
jgi:hypothetical protein